MSRQSSFNITLSFFWTISAILLLFLVKTLPEDQDAMEEGLVRYAEELARHKAGFIHIKNGSDLLQDQEIDEVGIKEISTYNDTESIVSIEDYRTSFDGEAAKRSIDFMRQGFKELTDEMVTLGNGCRPCDSDMELSDQQDREDDAALEEILPQEEMQRRQLLWKKQREQQQRRPRDLEDINEKDEGDKTETTPLLGPGIDA